MANFDYLRQQANGGATGQVTHNGRYSVGEGIRQNEDEQYNEYYEPIRQYALGLVNGEGLPSLQDMQTSAQMGIGAQYSNANASTAAQMASRGMAGSGMQARSARNLRRGEALDRYGAKSKAESEWNSMRSNNMSEGMGLQLDLADRDREYKAARKFSSDTDKIKEL